MPSGGGAAALPLDPDVDEVQAKHLAPSVGHF